MQTKPDPQLMAYKALTLAPELSGSARQVAGALLDHFNRKTMQCDPTIETLGDLTLLSQATVKRALSEICDDKNGTDDSKYFERWPHQGKSGRTFYLPRWRRFDAVLSAWSEARKRRNRGWRGSGGVGSEVSLGSDHGNGSEVSLSHGPGDGSEMSLFRDGNTGSEVSPTQAQKRALHRLKSEPQTPYRNPFKKPYAVAPATSEASGGVEKVRSGPSWEAAHKRLARHVGDLDKGDRERAYLLTSEGWDTAIAAERQKRGSGLPILTELMRSEAGP